MSNNYLSQSVTMLQKYLLMLVLVITGTVTASAANKGTTDWGEMTVGTAYQFDGLQSIYTGHFTAPEAGVLVVSSSSSDVITPYADEALETRIDYTYMRDTETGHAYYKLTLTAGQTVYFQYKSIGSGTNTLTFGDDAVKKIKVTSSYPDAGSTVMCTQNRQIGFQFNTPVACDGVQLVNGDFTKSLDAQISSNSVYLNIKDVFYDLMSKGSLKEGDNFTIRVINVRNADDETDVLGDVTASFVCGKKPVALVNEGNFSTTHKFLSFWPTGNADGIFTLTFDGELQPATAEGNTTKVTLTYGDNSSGAEASARYTENPAFTIAGNTLTVDLTGKERTPYSMLGTNTKYDVINFNISRVRDAQGYPVYSSASGTIGSFSRSLPYETISVEANTEFTPANGESLKGEDNLEVFATDYEKFEYDGVNFAYTLNDKTDTILVAKSDITATADADMEGAYSITIPVPEVIKSNAAVKNVKVTFAGLKAADGQDYSSKFTAVYDGFAVTSATYQANNESAAIDWVGGQLDTLMCGAQLTFAINKTTDEVGYMTYRVDDLNPAEGQESVIKVRSSIRYNADANQWQSEVYGNNNAKLYLGHTYQVTVDAYTTESDYSRYHKAPIGTYTFTFSGTSEPYVYSDINIESITPQDSTIASADDFKIVVNFDGLVKMIEGATCIAGGAASEDVPFTLIPTTPTDDGYASQWTLTLSESQIKAQDAQQITVNIAAEDQDGHRIKGNHGFEETSITQIPFKLGYQGAEITLVSPEVGEDNVVTSLYEFVVSSEKPLMVSGFVAEDKAGVSEMLSRQFVKVAKVKPIYTDDVQEVVDYIDQYGYEAALEHFDKDTVRVNNAMNATTNQIRLTLEREITEPGTYTFSIPADYFCAGEGFDSDNSKAFEATFYIEEPDTPVDYTLVTDPEDGSTVTSLKKIKLTFEGLEAVGTESGKISVKKDGVEIASIDADFDWDEPENVMFINLPEEQTENGVYTIEIPEGYFVDIDYNYLPAATLTYYIGENTGINNATINASASKKVYTLSGIRVSGKLPAGVYIKGGKKVIVK